MKDLRNSDSSSSHICEVKLRINTVELLSQILQLYCCCTCCRALLSGLQLSFYFDLLILLLYFKLFLSNSDIVAEIGVLLLVKSVDYTTVHTDIPVDRKSCLMENTFFFCIWMNLCSSHVSAGPQTFSTTRTLETRNQEMTNQLFQSNMNLIQQVRNKHPWLYIYFRLKVNVLNQI